MQSVTEYVSTFPSKAAAARAMGIPITTLKDRITAETRRSAANAGSSRIETPSFPDPDLPIDELLSQRDRTFKLKTDALRAGEWFDIKVKDNEPMGIVWMTDPHLDDDGCDWPALRRDADLIASTPNVWAISGGDLSNNWVGRLERKWADQSTTVGTARKLIEWYLTGAGIRWLAICHGNHEHFNRETSALIKRMVVGTSIPVIDWKCCFSLTFANGESTRIAAAHNWKGHSWFHSLHGLIKHALVGGDNADVILGGHIHSYGVMHLERENGTMVWAARGRGYKSNDHYALVNGFHEGKNGCAVMLVIDPTKPAHLRNTVYGSVEQGVEALRILQDRRKAEAKKKKRPKAKRAKKKGGR